MSERQSPEKPELFWEGVLDQVLGEETEKHIEEQLAWARSAPGDPRPCLNLGILYYLSGRVEDAIQMHQEALARDPAFALPHQHLAQIYIVLGDLEKAWEHARLAAERGNTVVLDMLSRYPNVNRSRDPGGQ